MPGGWMPPREGRTATLSTNQQNKNRRMIAMIEAMKI